MSNIRSTTPALPWQTERKPGCDVCGKTGFLKYMIVGVGKWLCEKCKWEIDQIEKALHKIWS